MMTRTKNLIYKGFDDETFLFERLRADVFCCLNRFLFCAGKPMGWSLEDGSFLAQVLRSYF